MEAMFFVEYVGTLQGSTIEKAVKDYCHKKFHNRLCTAKGRILIYGMVVEYAQQLHQANPKANLPAIEKADPDCASSMRLRVTRILAEADTITSGLLG